MLEESLLFFFSFFSLLLVAVGHVIRSPNVMIFGALFILITGMLFAPDGIKVYDGTKNMTIGYSDITNATIRTYNSTPNYYLQNGFVVQGLGILYGFMGIVILYFAVTMPPLPPREISDVG